MKEVTDLLTQELNIFLDKSELTSENIVPVVIKLMQMIEKYTLLYDIHGKQKKEVILDTLLTFVNDEYLSIEIKTTMRILLDTTIPSLIDSIILLDGNLVKIKTRVSRIYRIYTELRNLCRS
jgi:hypothetical protein